MVYRAGITQPAQLQNNKKLGLVIVVSFIYRLKYWVLYTESIIEFL